MTTKLILVVLMRDCTDVVSANNVERLGRDMDQQS